MILNREKTLLEAEKLGNLVKFRSDYPYNKHSVEYGFMQGVEYAVKELSKQPKPTFWDKVKKFFSSSNVEIKNVSNSSIKINVN